MANYQSSYTGAEIDAAIGKVSTIESEVDNIRIGADGTTYPSAGDAVREQISDLNVYTKAYEDVNLIDASQITLHAYIRNDDGNVRPVTNPAAADYVKCVSDYIPVKSGSTLYLSGDTFLYSQLFGWYDSTKAYLGGKDTYGGMGYSLHVANVKVPDGASYLRITFRTEEDAEVSWADYTGTAPTDEVIYATDKSHVDYHYYPVNPCDFNGKDISVFNKILCIGDSITAGYFNHSNGGITIGKYSYPAILQKITGVECVNLGDSGDTSVSWWNTYQSYDYSGFDCAIINLGINDVLLSVSEADTRAAFANIINALKSANNGIKIFIATIVPAYARGNTTYDAMNTIIKDIVNNTVNAYLVDLTEYGHAIGAGYAYGHLTACGYRQLAEDYCSAISYIIRNNPEEFRWVQFIGTNYSA